MKQWRWYVYIVECKDKIYYTGMTWNIWKREAQHQSGKGAKYTSKHGFERIAYFEEHNDFETAREREKQIKNWSQEKKLNLIKGI